VTHYKTRFDRMGSLASTACAAHCLVCSFLPTAIAASGLGFLLHPSVEWGLVLVAATLALIAARMGYRQHRSGRIAAALLGGATLLVAARFLESWGIESLHIAVAGGLGLAAAHITNLRTCARVCCEASPVEV